MHNTTKTLITDWRPYPALPTNADRMIKDAVDDKRESTFETLYESREIVQYQNTPQRFAIFDQYAYELQAHIFRNDDEYAVMRAAVLNDVAYLSSPDEGRDGVLHWMLLWRQPETWSLIWLASCGWIRAHELQLRPHEIHENIADELDNGTLRILGD